VQIALVVTFSLVTVFQFHYWAPTDEEAHFSNIQQIAQHGSLPVLGKTETSQQGLAILQGIYPRPTTIDPKHFGLGGLAYEAFQPPLYYIVAVPVFDIAGNYIHKIYALRIFDLLLLLGTVALTARLNRVVLRERWMIGWSMTLVFFLLPGVIVRFVTISNLALAAPLTMIFATELWIAWRDHSSKRLMVAGAVVGLCVLTELELIVLLPVLGLVVVAEAYRRRSFPAVLPLVVAVAIPLVLIAPWFAFNEAHYHMLTAGPIAIREQMQVVNPQHLHFSLSQLPNDTVASILDPTLPGEWGPILAGHAALSYLDQLVAVLLLPAGLVMILSLGRRLWSIPTAILGLPWLLIVFEMWYIRYGEQWAIFVRYTYSVIPILLTLVAVSTDTFRARFMPVLVTALATTSVAIIWFFIIFGFTGPYQLR
jgi:4-amino-4-deoxy-L-arabinose transferase-like glycosyltransferase